MDIFCRGRLLDDLRLASPGPLTPSRVIGPLRPLVSRPPLVVTAMAP